MDTRAWTKQSSRILVSSTKRTDTVMRVKEAKARGFVAITDIIEDIDFEGRTHYVCVMEHPKMKAERQAKTPH